MPSCRKLKELIDSFFVYDTASYVRIKDKRLASLQFLAMFAIFVYVVCWTIVWNQTYLILETPTGSVRINPLKPSKWSEVADLPYCKRPDNPTYNGFPTYTCMYWDEALNVFPIGLDNTITLSSRMSIDRQSVDNCSLTDPHCTWKDTEPEEVDYLADVERFTLLIDHAYYAPTVRLQGSAKALPGLFLGSDGKAIHPEAPNVVGEPGKYDILEVSELLKAGGIELDGPSYTNESISLRYDGCVVFVYIEYSNTYTWNLYKMRYTIKVEASKGTKFKAVQPVYTKKVEDRVVYDRHGIHFIFLQTGRLGKFDFQTLLLSFVSGIGLITVSTVVVDFIATKILKAKDVVTELKYHETGNLLSLEEKDLLILAQRLRQINSQLLPLNEAPGARGDLPSPPSGVASTSSSEETGLRQPLLEQQQQQA